MCEIRALPRPRATAEGVAEFQPARVGLDAGDNAVVTWCGLGHGRLVGAPPVPNPLEALSRSLRGAPGWQPNHSARAHRRAPPVAQPVLRLGDRSSPMRRFPVQTPVGQDPVGAWTLKEPSPHVRHVGSGRERVPK